MTGLCTLQEFLQLFCGYLFCVSCPPWECTENSIPASSRQNLQVLKAITSSTSGKLGNFLVNVVSSRGFFLPNYTPISHNWCQGMLPYENIAVNSNQYYLRCNIPGTAKASFSYFVSEKAPVSLYLWIGFLF